MEDQEEIGTAVLPPAGGEDEVEAVAKGVDLEVCTTAFEEADICEDAPTVDVTLSVNVFPPAVSVVIHELTPLEPVAFDITDEGEEVEVDAMEAVDVDECKDEETLRVKVFPPPVRVVSHEVPVVESEM
ncbi:MAG: hypothetical protein Q9170_007650 [Blastenia crenularia]